MSELQKALLFKPPVLPSPSGSTISLKDHPDLQRLCNCYFETI